MGGGWGNLTIPDPDVDVPELTASDATSLAYKLAGGGDAFLVVGVEFGSADDRSVIVYARGGDGTWRRRGQPVFLKENGPAAIDGEGTRFVVRQGARFVQVYDYDASEDAWLKSLEIPVTSSNFSQGVALSSDGGTLAVSYGTATYGTPGNIEGEPCVLSKCILSVPGREI